MGEPIEWVHFLQNIFAFYILFDVIFVASYYAKEPVLSVNPLLVTLLFNFVFVHNTMSLMVAHLTKSKYNPWNRLYLFVVGVLSINTLIGVLFK